MTENPTHRLLLWLNAPPSARWDRRAVAARYRQALALGLCTVGLTIVIPWAEAADAAPSPTFANIPNVRIQYYDVPGRTAEEIRKAINQKALVDERDGRSVDALSRTFLKWRWKESAARGCVVLDPEVEFSAIVILPKLTQGEKIGPVLRAQWQRYAKGLERHEAGHLQNAYSLIGSIRKALAGSRCAAADAAASAAFADLEALDNRYDITTDHGRKQGATFP